MAYQESETIELKATVVEDLKKDIIAFANGSGGKLYIGVSDDGTIIGVDNPDQAAVQVSNMVRDAIKPDLTMFLHYETIEDSGRSIIEVTVQPGTDRPYYLGKKGMRPEGVYVRQGYSSVPTTDAAIRRMIKDTDGDHFEEMRSLDQNLTFEAVNAEFLRRKVEFGPEQMRTLKFVDRDGLYTNLALLLSDQCPHTTKVAVFQETAQPTFRDRREFSGSIIKQMNDIYHFLDYRNQTAAKFEGLLRIDQRNYPEMALREALMNHLVHRDYSFSASSLINLYEDRLEFISVGGLLTGIELDDVLAGISFCRNQALANVFYRLELIEAYGTGMARIRDAYQDFTVHPRIQVTKNSFNMILPNCNVDTSKTTGFSQEENRLREKAESEEINLSTYKGKGVSLWGNPAYLILD